MLQMRPGCECCDSYLPANGSGAMTALPARFPPMTERTLKAGGCPAAA
jgi:hypothetical protein